jgi:hypothetical protein
MKTKVFKIRHFKMTSLSAVCCLLLLAVGCNDNTEPALRVNPRDFGVPREAATYTVAVTSDAPWTAAVSWNPSWLSIPPPVSGEGDGSITVSVDENNTFFPRTASLKVTSGDVSRAMDITQQGFPKPDAPANAASTNTWIFGTQLWSDEVQIPACDREPAPGEFFDQFTAPAQCASFVYNGKKHYYYNWKYVIDNAATLCPDPWKVPGKADLEVLHANLSHADFIANWGFPGYIYNGVADAQGLQHIIWSTENPRWFLISDMSNYFITDWTVAHGASVRCVAK